MKVLITGGSGLLGGYLKEELEHRKIDFYAPTSQECNVLNNETVGYAFAYYEPDVVIHCAAVAKFKLVDENPRRALLVNVSGTCNIVNNCYQNMTKLVYISTDHVFDGESGLYSTNEKINPISNYAKMKAAGELSALTYPDSLIVRTSFCPRIFPFDTAYTDKFTSQDYVDLIAPKILDAALSSETGIINIGHKRRSFYELAIERNPNVNKGSISEVEGPVLRDTSLEV